MLADDPAAPLDQHWRQRDLVVPWYPRARLHRRPAAPHGAGAPGDVQYAMPPPSTDEAQPYLLTVPSFAPLHEAIACA